MAEPRTALDALVYEMGTELGRRVLGRISTEVMTRMDACKFGSEIADDLLEIEKVLRTDGASEAEARRVANKIGGRVFDMFHEFRSGVAASGSGIQ